MSASEDLKLAEKKGKEYCQEWLDGPTDNMTPDKSQDSNPYQRSSNEFYAWEYGFWNELRRYMLSHYLQRNRLIRFNADRGDERRKLKIEAI